MKKLQFLLTRTSSLVLSYLFLMPDIVDYLAGIFPLESD